MLYQNIKFKKDRVAFLKEKLRTDEEWAVRGLMKLYEFQTNDEKNPEYDTEGVVNGVGFSRYDRETLTFFADFWKRKGYLPDKNMRRLLGIMPKYAKQLRKIADGEQTINKL